VTAEPPAAPDAPAWWRSGTIYQVYPRTFARGSTSPTADTTDSPGDLRGIIERLDHLAWLGVDAVWLSPIYASPQRDNGYDISDYQAVDGQFGTLDDFDELVAELHDRGMRLVLDLVVNHTSTEHPWFRESSRSADSPRRDWYHWRPARAGASPGQPAAEPTNWESYFSESAWQFHPATGEYYLHLFAVEQADLNWENPEVRAAVHAMMRWWLDRGVDGFRMDVINLISKRDPPADGPLFPGRELGDGSSYYVHGPRLAEFLQEMHAAVFAGRDAGLIRIGETPGISLDQARLLTDPRRRALDMVFQFEHVDLDRNPTDWNDPVPLRLTALKTSLARWQEGLAGVGWNSLYWGNHDQPRAVSRFGDDAEEHRVASAKTLATVLYGMQGTAFVYQGDELGMTNPELRALADLADVSAVNYYRSRVEDGVEPEEIMRRLRRTGRDNARAPMPWSTAALQSGRGDSVLAHYRHVIALRKRMPVLVDGAFRLLDPQDPQTFCYERIGARSRVLVVANFSSTSVPAERIPARPDWATGEPLLDTHPGTPLPAARSDSGLAPWRSFVWASAG
jgi:oligo-1,6-glucosidase